MDNLIKFDEFKEKEKVNEEFDIFGFDVVITLGELVGSVIAAAFIVGAASFFGYMSIRSWLRGISTNRKLLKDLKRLAKLLEKYKDDKIDGYLHSLKTKIHYIKSNERNKDVALDWKKISNYLKSKMSEGDKEEYEDILSRFQHSFWS